VIRRWKNNGDANEDTYNIAYMVSMGKVIRAAAAKLAQLVTLTSTTAVKGLDFP
jgi:hypothetical protein